MRIVRACHNLGLTVTGFGADQAAALRQFAHAHPLLALLRDGFHPQSVGGHVGLGVVRPDGTHWHVAGLSVHDGSLFPTSVGANPQLSVYGLAARLAAGLAKSFTGRDVRLT